MKFEYCVSRISNRWPLALFYMLLNIAEINSVIIFRERPNGSGINRRKYLKELSMMLRKGYTIHRASIDCIVPNVKICLRSILGLGEENQRHLTVNQTDNDRCAYCDRKKIRKTKLKCVSCSLFICKEHTSPSCVQC